MMISKKFFAFLAVFAPMVASSAAPFAFLSTEGNNIADHCTNEDMFGMIKAHLVEPASVHGRSLVCTGIKSSYHCESFCYGIPDIYCQFFSWGYCCCGTESCNPRRCCTGFRGYVWEDSYGCGHNYRNLREPLPEGVTPAMGLEEEETGAATVPFEDSPTRRILEGEEHLSVECVAARSTALELIKEHDEVSPACKAKLDVVHFKCLVHED